MHTDQICLPRPIKITGYIKYMLLRNNLSDFAIRTYESYEKGRNETQLDNSLLFLYFLILVV